MLFSRKLKRITDLFTFRFWELVFRKWEIHICIKQELRNKYDYLNLGIKI